MPTYKYLNDTGLERTLSKLKTYIDSQSGGGSDGHGFIICDTSTMQVGDRIRVRSVYTVLEEQYNQTKEVVTVGQPVTFAVPCYDYYKVCTVQDTSAIAYVYIQQSLTGYEAKVSYSGNIKWQSETGTYEDNYIKLYRETANDDWTLKAVGTCVYDGNTYTSGQTIATLPYNQSTTYCVNATAPTEIGGVYKTVDYGQTLFINVLDKTTLGGIQGILNAGQQSTLLSVGDEVTLLVDGANEQWQIAHINPSNASYPSNSVILARKETYGSVKITTKPYATGTLKSYMSNFYGLISARDKAYIKQKTVNAAYSTSAISTSTDNYVWCPTSWEMSYTINSNERSTNVPFSLFATQVGRTKGNAYWTATGYQNGTGMVYVNASGVTGNSGDLSPTYATLPCIMLTADS